MKEGELQIEQIKLAQKSNREVGEELVGISQLPLCNGVHPSFLGDIYLTLGGFRKDGARKIILGGKGVVFRRSRKRPLRRQPKAGAKEGSLRRVVYLPDNSLKVVYQDISPLEKLRFRQVKPSVQSNRSE